MAQDSARTMRDAPLAAFCCNDNMLSVLEYTQVCYTIESSLCFALIKDIISEHLFARALTSLLVGSTAPARGRVSADLAIAASVGGASHAQQGLNNPNDLVQTSGHRRKVRPGNLLAFTGLRRMQLSRGPLQSATKVISLPIVCIWKSTTSGCIAIRLGIACHVG